MRGATPKPPALRQRRNRPSSRAMLPPEGTRARKAPELPKGHAWNTLTRSWWRDVWASPMATEFLQADVHGLYVLAELVDRFWAEPSTGLAAEIRQHRTAFGLTPMDRRRLEWQVERAESVRKRHRPKVPAEDPRSLLRAVK